MRGVVPIRLPPLAGVLLYVNFTYLHFLVLAIHFTLPYHTRNCYKSTELKSEGPKKCIEPTLLCSHILIAININAQCTLLCKPIEWHYFASLGESKRVYTSRLREECNANRYEVGRVTAAGDLL